MKAGEDWSKVKVNFVGNGRLKEAKSKAKKKIKKNYRLVRSHKTGSLKEF